MQSKKELIAMYLWRIFKDIIPNILEKYLNRVNPSIRKNIAIINDDREIIKYVIRHTPIKGETKNILHDLLNYSNIFAHNRKFDINYIAGLLHTTKFLFWSEIGRNPYDATFNANMWKSFVEAQCELNSLNPEHINYNCDRRGRCVPC